MVTDLTDPRKLDRQLAQAKAEMQPRSYHRTKGFGMGSASASRNGGEGGNLKKKKSIESLFCVSTAKGEPEEGR